ncbi:MAG: hypothetical protein ACJ74U_04045 [Jatrophihabitantaceae bacterium]
MLTALGVGVPVLAGWLAGATVSGVLAGALVVDAEAGGGGDRCDEPQPADPAIASSVAAATSDRPSMSRDSSLSPAAPFPGRGQRLAVGRTRHSIASRPAGCPLRRPQGRLRRKDDYRPAWPGISSKES